MATLGFAGCTESSRTNLDTQAIKQHEIVVAGALLNADGHLREPGWSRREQLYFNRDAVTQPADRLRQWDFFTVMDESGALDLTLVDLGFIALGSAAYTEFTSGRTVGGFALRDEASDVFALSTTAHGLTEFRDKDAEHPYLKFQPFAGGRQLTFNFPKSTFGDQISGVIELTEPPNYEYLALATPFDQGMELFFYEQKIPGLVASGIVTAAGETFQFKQPSAFAVLDWGRGVWPGEVLWRWGQAAGQVGDVEVAFNLGNGFGDMRAGSENIIIFDGHVHKLGEVDWHYSVTDPETTWYFNDRDGYFELQLQPIHIAKSEFSLGTRFANLTKAYGRFSGTFKLADGQVRTVPAFWGFAEQMHLRWH